MTDRQLLISAALGVGAICATVAGSSCLTNPRINDLQANLIDFRAAVRSEFQSVRGEIQSVRDKVEGVRVEIQDVRAELRDVRDEVVGVRGLLIDHLDGHERGGPAER